MLIQLLAPGPLPLADVLAKCEEVAHADTVRQVLGAVAQQRDGHYHLLEDAAVWNAVNPVDAGYTPEQRQAVQKQLARLKPLLASPSASLGSSWASGTDCGDLTQSVQDRAELLQRYRELRKEAETIRNRFKMMAKVFECVLFASVCLLILAPVPQARRSQPLIGGPSAGRLCQEPTTTT